jgi:DNA excision repair protein ERCC-2
MSRAPSKEIIQEVQSEERAAKEEKARRLGELAPKGGGILLAVQGGFFSDSPEFKRNTLHGILVVGVPYSKPDIEQRAAAEFMKSRFGGMKGYYYSQIYPAMTKVLHVLSGGAGGDKGVCVLMDQRFKDSKFLKALPPEYHFDIEPDIKSRLGEFFSCPDPHLMLPGEGDKYQH